MRPARDDRSYLATLKLYIALVLIPQLLWAVSHATAGGYAYLSFCEGCMPYQTTSRSERTNNDVAVVRNISALDLCTCRFDRDASHLEDRFITEPTDSHGGW